MIIWMSIFRRKNVHWSAEVKIQSKIKSDALGNLFYSSSYVYGEIQEKHTITDFRDMLKVLLLL